VTSSIGQADMATLKEFEDALRQHGMTNALAILEQLKMRDRERRSIAPARRVVGRKMTAELARTVIEMHATTGMTQQEIAFKLGVNQGRVNEVIKRGKWLNGDPAAPEALSRDKAMERLEQRAKVRRAIPVTKPAPKGSPLPKARPLQPEPMPHSAGELPLSRPERVIEKVAPATPSRTPLRRVSEEPTPIVSAQLAFLDL
jgi:hypothetical protein